MNLSSIRIILVATSHPGNIGSAARAMKTMGLSSLYLVAPKMFPHPKAYELAAGADDVLNTAFVADTLDEALVGCQLILGTSARPRGLALRGLLPAESAQLVSQQEAKTQVAIVFGREHAGLTNEELLKCHYHINIPSNPDYSSLNLAQAVQIIAYEMRLKSKSESKLKAELELNLSTKTSTALRQEEYATADAIEQFYTHLKEVLITIGFLRIDNPRRLMERVRRLFTRINLEKIEVNLLRGMLSQIQKSLNGTAKTKVIRKKGVYSES